MCAWLDFVWYAFYWFPSKRVSLSTFGDSGGCGERVAPYDLNGTREVWGLSFSFIVFRIVCCFCGPCFIALSLTAHVFDFLHLDLLLTSFQIHAFFSLSFSVPMCRLVVKLLCVVVHLSSYLPPTSVLLFVVPFVVFISFSLFLCGYSIWIKDAATSNDMLKIQPKKNIQRNVFTVRIWNKTTVKRMKGGEKRKDKIDKMWKKDSETRERANVAD